MRSLRLLVLTLLLAASASADPYGETTTRLDYNAETNRLEAAIRVLPEQVEAALEGFAWDADDAEARLAALARDAFRVTVPGESGDPEEAPQTFVGFERESHREAWLYVEIALPEGASELTIRQSLFFDLMPTQTNALRLRVGETIRAWLFTRETPEWTVELTPSRPGTDPG